MARIRSVKPEFWLDRKLARGVSRDARLLYIGLWNHADEHGRLHGDPAVIKGQVFPYDSVDIDALLAELVKLGRVVSYEVDGDPYLFLPKLAAHQRLEAQKVPSRLPAPPDPLPDPPKSAPRADKPAPRAESPETIDALQVAGGMEQVAGGMEQVAGSRRSAPSGAQTESLTVNQRSKRLTDAYHAVEPMSKWPAVNGIVKQAIEAARWSDEEIHDALLRLAKESRSVTVDSLRTELVGFTPRANRAEQRTQQSLRLVDQARALDQAQQRGEIA
jgi:hypothetical protein